MDLHSIAIIGPGRAGTAIRDRLRAYGRDALLTREPGAAASADLVLVATPDDSIALVAAALDSVAHLGMLSGATPLAALGGRNGRFVLHPVQTLSKDGGAAQLDGTTAFLTARDPAGWSAARALCECLDVRGVELDEGVRPLPHAACVIASNYILALEALAVDLLGKAGVDHSTAIAALGPLVERTIARSLDCGDFVPTGPIARGDAGTIRRHLAALDRTAPDTSKLYRALGEALLPLVPEEAAERARRELHATPEKPQPCE
jgi:predicted short-subunit dehydrogenase-like oxidoreductase (DUF2520 family)